MEIGAVLDHLHLASPAPESAAGFYAAHFGMRASLIDEVWMLTGPMRRLAISAGTANRLKYAAWRCADRAALTAQRARVPAALQLAPPYPALFDGQAFAVRAGQLFPQPGIERSDGSRVLLDDLLGPGFAYIGWRADAVPPVLATLAPGFSAQALLLQRKGDAFGATEGGPALRDSEGVIEQTLAAAAAQAVLLRPDRYVLAYLSAADCAGGMLALRELLRRHAALAGLE